MLEILEIVTGYRDNWNMTFYYILVLVLLAGFFWTYMQIIVKPLGRKRAPLKENIIYNNPEDLIEKDYNNERKKKI